MGMYILSTMGCHSREVVMVPYLATANLYNMGSGKNLSRESTTVGRHHCLQTPQRSTAVIA
jgi:hypothetical protein